MRQYLLHPVVLVVLFFGLLFLPDARTGRKKVSTGKRLKKVVSLSPSITRAIIDLGAEDVLVGVTTYHPPLKKKVAIVGSVVQTNIEKIVLLRADMVLSSREDNRFETMERLKAVGIKTMMFARNHNFHAISDTYRALADVLGRKIVAEKKLGYYSKVIRKARCMTGNKRVALFISHQPLMGISNRSFLGNVIADAGGKNVFSLFSAAYPIVSIEHVVALDPDVIISVMHDGIQGSGFFYQVLKAFPRLAVVKNRAVFTVSPEITCYYTPRVYANAVVAIAEILQKAGLKKKT